MRYVRRFRTSSRFASCPANDVIAERSKDARNSQMDKFVDKSLPFRKARYVMEFPPPLHHFSLSLSLSLISLSYLLSLVCAQFLVILHHCYSQSFFHLPHCKLYVAGARDRPEVVAKTRDRCRRFSRVRRKSREPLTRFDNDHRTSRNSLLSLYMPSTSEKRLYSWLSLMLPLLRVIHWAIIFPSKKKERATVRCIPSFCLFPTPSYFPLSRSWTFLRTSIVNVEAISLI